MVWFKEECPAHRMDCPLGRKPGGSTRAEKNRYEILRADCVEKGWICHVIPIEAGCGLIGHSVISFLSKIGITGRSLKVALNRLQTAEWSLTCNLVSYLGQTFLREVVCRVCSQRISSPADRVLYLMLVYHYAFVIGWPGQLGLQNSLIASLPMINIPPTSVLDMTLNKLMVRLL